MSLTTSFDRRGESIAAIRILFHERTRPFPNRQWWVEKVARSRFVHVSVEAGGIVMYPLWDKGVLYWTADAFASCPGFTTFIEVEADSWPDLNRYQSGVNKPLWRYIARWASRGLIQHIDCVTTARRVLADGGIDTPNRIVTPAQFFDHLVSRGYKAYGQESFLERVG